MPRQKNPFSERRPFLDDDAERSDDEYLSVEDRRKLHRRPMDHSLTFALLLYVNIFYFGLFAGVEFVLLLLKAYTITDVRHVYTPTVLINEFFVLVFMVAVESCRLYLGQKHELDGFDKSLANVFYILSLTIPSMYSVAYFTMYQQFVTNLDSVLGAIMLIIQASQFISAFLNLWPKFMKKRA